MLFLSSDTLLLLPKTFKGTKNVYVVLKNFLWENINNMKLTILFHPFIYFVALSTFIYHVWLSPASVSDLIHFSKGDLIFLKVYPFSLFQP